MLPTRKLPGGRARRADLSTGPNGLPLCRWCELEILAKRRRTFCSDYCVHQWRLRTDPGYLRDQVFARDRGRLRRLPDRHRRRLRRAQTRARRSAGRRPSPLRHEEHHQPPQPVGRRPHPPRRRRRRPVRPRQPPHALPAVPPRRDPAAPRPAAREEDSASAKVSGSISSFHASSSITVPSFAVRSVMVSSRIL